MGFDIQKESWNAMDAKEQLYSGRGVSKKLHF
jgi:hypothetical protein